MWRPQRRSGPAHSWTCALAPSPPAPAPPAARRPPLFSMPSPIPQCDIQRGPRAAAPLRLWEAAPGSASPTSACIAALVRTLAALPPRRRRHVMPRRQHTACLSAAQGRRRHKACTKAQSQLDMSCLSGRAQRTADTPDGQSGRTGVASPLAANTTFYLSYLFVCRGASALAALGAASTHAAPPTLPRRRVAERWAARGAGRGTAPRT